jgi:hypothetical protein
MTRIARMIVVAAVLALPLGGCVNFDPQDMLAGDWFGNKKPLPGERKELFPGGVPGVSRGVPPDLMPGSQTAALQGQEDEVPQVRLPEEAKPKAKAKPKPRPTAAQEPERRPTAVTVRPQSGPPQQAPQQTRWPDPPPPPRPQSTQWPDPPAQRQTQQQGVQWPDPPATR